jgi:gluconolactonase
MLGSRAASVLVFVTSCLGLAACAPQREAEVVDGETVDTQTATIEATPAPEPQAAEAAPVAPPAPAPILKGLAAKVCPPGPFLTGPAGGLSAIATAGSEPTALDAKDTGFHLYEGPVWLDGVLYFSDFKTTPGFPSRILAYTAGTGVRVVLPDSGTNGLALDASGQHLVGARHKSKSVVNFSTDLKTISDIAAKFEGKSFDSPNDLVFRSDGNLYFTDPDFQAGSHKDQKSTNVYRVSPSGEVSVVDATINNPNGIALAPDESALYVAGNLEQGFVKRYPIAPDGSVGEGSLLIAHVVVPDGMVFDCAGNLYVTEHTQRRVRVFAPTGNEVATISGMDKNVTNVAFGGTDRTTLFITTTGGLYEIELPVPGLPY